MSIKLTKARWTTPTAGFSLVELMIAVVIIGVLAALSAPSVSRSMERSRYHDFNRALANGFQESRMFAMNSGQAVLVDIGDDGVRFYTPTNFEVGEGGAMSCPMAVDDGPNASNVLFTVAPVAFGLENLTMEVMPATATRVCISPQGRVLTNTGQIISSGCETFNFLLWNYPTSAVRLAGSCPGFEQDERDNRQIYNMRAVHVGYSGNVRVIY